jgi:hypothetical protein
LREETKLAAEQIQNLTWVNVDTNEGVVYLTGNAKTPEAKAHATEIAQRVDGVERVVNDIHVTGTEQARSRPHRNPRRPPRRPAPAPPGRWSERWWRSTIRSRSASSLPVPCSDTRSGSVFGWSFGLPVMALSGWEDAARRAPDYSRSAPSFARAESKSV